MVVQRRAVAALNQELDLGREESEHRTDEERSRTGRSRRGSCSCGWRGPWRRALDAGWQATADADEHVNDQ